MPSFRGLPPSLRPTVRPKHTHPDVKSIHIPVARAMVDCGIYVNGQRAPGKYTHAAALNKVHELEREGKDAFVWIGLHEPDEHQMQAVADVFGFVAKNEFTVDQKSILDGPKRSADPGVLGRKKADHRDQQQTGIEPFGAVSLHKAVKVAVI